MKIAVDNPEALLLLERMITLGHLEGVSLAKLRETARGLKILNVEGAINFLKKSKVIRMDGASAVRGTKGFRGVISQGQEKITEQVENWVSKISGGGKAQEAVNVAEGVGDAGREKLRKKAVGRIAGRRKALKVAAKGGGKQLLKGAARFALPAFIAWMAYDMTIGRHNEKKRAAAEASRTTGQVRGLFSELASEEAGQRKIAGRIKTEAVFGGESEKLGDLLGGQAGRTLNSAERSRLGSMAQSNELNHMLLAKAMMQ